jgi:hypothetical protein
MPEAKLDISVCRAKAIAKTSAARPVAMNELR